MPGLPSLGQSPREAFFTGYLLTAIRIPQPGQARNSILKKWNGKRVGFSSHECGLGDGARATGLSASACGKRVAARPLRLKAVEDAVRDRCAVTHQMAGACGCAGRHPLQFNAYKIPLMRNW
jgi:CO/xanthine dehydrogenase FAD-binding subunit